VSLKRTLPTRSALDLLSNDRPMDETAGIRIATVLDDPINAYYITDIAPGRSVNPHFHCQGDEVYIILGGNGVIHIWDVEEPSSVESQAIGNGSVFRIPPKIAHQLENNGEEPLILLFACAPDHLGSDRFAVPSRVEKDAACRTK
jgi:mannose-6-phosphate isomerase-like protein (cupin superfamily)